jgi:hypothetical protein
MHIKTNLQEYQKIKKRTEKQYKKETRPCGYGLGVRKNFFHSAQASKSHNPVTGVI